MKFHLLKKYNSIWLLLLILPVGNGVSQTLVLEKQIHHLRVGNHPEWLSFSEAHQTDLKIDFEYTQTAGKKTISLRQEDVKQNWLLRLNGKDLGKLIQDENAMIVYFVVPDGFLKTGQNTLLIEPADTIVDDIRVGNIVLIDRPLQKVITQGKVEISVRDGQTGSLLPSRITIVNKDGALQPVGVIPNRDLAVRAGCIYTGKGDVSFGLPAGVYTIYANHGFEFGVDSARLVVKAGAFIKRKLVISREVQTRGWISSDTHIHTNYYPGDGDAISRERVLTIAGEGIELPVLTDHNVKTDLDSLALAMKMRKYFTMVVGYEFTTPVGHFNVFPVATNTFVPDYHVNSWNGVVENLHNKDNPKIVILNHARDIHMDFRPFDPEYHLSSAGVDLRGWKFPANAMEVINSSASLTDYMCLYEDWFGMMNRGYWLTPVGASDSHTVSRFLLGQARTYIKSKNVNPGNIDINDAIENFREGKVMISFGLLTEMVVDNKYGPGDIVPSSAKELTISVSVMGPAWTKADRIILYANGVKIREDAIPNGGKPGLKFSKTWKMPRPKKDLFLVAIAEGPGSNRPFWPLPKPYQNTSPVWNPKVIGSTGAVWIDGDGDGQRTSAYEYANKLLEVSKGNIDHLVEELTSYDEAVAVQVAAILQEQGQNLGSPAVSKALENAAPFTKSGFQKFIREYQVLKSANISNNHIK